MQISIIISTFNRKALLANCLSSISKSFKVVKTSTEGETIIEVIIIHNGEGPYSHDFYQYEGLEFSVKEVKKQTPSECRNLAVKLASYQDILFLDDDVTLPPQYFSELHRINSETNWQVLGGPDQEYLNVTPLESALNIVLQSPLATSKTRYRHTKNPKVIRGSESNLILCNLLIKKDIISKIKFDPRLFRGEENALIHLIEEKHPEIKSRCFHDPSLYVHHKRRDTIRQICSGIFGSGLYRAKSFYLYPRSFSLSYTLPSLFIIYLVSLFSPFSILWPIYLYALLNIFFSIKLTFRRPSLIFLVSLLQFVIICVYGLGFLRGLTIPLIREKRNDKVALR